METIQQRVAMLVHVIESITQNLSGAIAPLTEETLISLQKILQPQVEGKMDSLLMKDIPVGQLKEYKGNIELCIKMAGIFVQVRGALKERYGDKVFDEIMGVKPKIVLAEKKVN